MNLEQIIQLPYEDFVKSLKEEISKKKILSIIKNGREDGLPNDEKVKFTKRNSIAKQLKPLQKQLIFEKSILWSLQCKNADTIKLLLSGKKEVKVDNKEIITLNNKYILDGHHRWVEAYCINPESIISVYDIEMDITPIKALKMIQLSIASDIEKIPYSSNEGTNILTTSLEKLTKLVNENICNKLLKIFNKSKDEITDIIINNIKLLRKNNKPISNAPDRIYMPQTSKSDNYDKKLKNGEINFKKPFVKENLKYILNFNNFINENNNTFKYNIDKYYNHKDKYNRWTVTFTTDKNIKYKLYINDTIKNGYLDKKISAWEFEVIDVEDGFSTIVNKGEIYKVLSTIFNILKEYSYENNTDYYYYRASNTITKDNAWLQRANIYNRYFKKYFPNCEIIKYTNNSFIVKLNK